MFATSIIVFREAFEAALVIAILVAACRGLPGLATWLAGGIAAGVVGSLVVALAADVIMSAAGGMGQELLNAAVLAAAVLMLGWHTIWMASHGRELAQQASRVGKAAADGSGSLIAVAIVVAATVLREGSETVLFLNGLAMGGGVGALDLVAGAAIGIGGAVLLGVLVARGLLRVPLRHLFTVTSALILLVAAGMASQAAGFGVQAGVLPPLASPLWDTSALLTEQSIAGKVLHALTGYVARPAGVQVLAYVSTIALLLVASRLARSRSGSARDGGAAKAASSPAAAVVAVAVLLATMSAEPARAEFKLRYPNIDYREVEIESNFSATFDRRADKNHNLSFPTEIGIGILPFWFFEVEIEAEKVPGERASFEALTFENYFMLTEPGKYWLDASIFAEYARAQKADAADSVTLGLLLQKQSGKWLNTANVYWEHEVGALASSADGFKYGWQTRYMLNPLFQPGIEVYGEIEDLNKPGRLNEQQLRLGPMFAGSYNLGEVGGRGKFKYELGYLFGTTTATEERTLRTRVEYEIGF